MVWGRKSNKERRIFPNEISLEKSLYLVTEIITEKWTSKYSNWGVILRELKIHYTDDRIPDTTILKIIVSKFIVDSNLHRILDILNPIILDIHFMN